MLPVLWQSSINGAGKSTNSKEVSGTEDLANSVEQLEHELHDVIGQLDLSVSRRWMMAI